MFSPVVSIIISSFNRLPLFRRTLWAIAKRGPSVSFEVIVVDDGSSDDVLGELRAYSSVFAWKFIRFDGDIFTEKTGLKKFLNNPCVTNNIGFAHSQGSIVIQQGNEVLPYGKCYDQMLLDIPSSQNWMVMSTTYDLRQQYLDELDEYGTNLSARHLEESIRWPLQSIHYRSDVTNYICAASRSLWDAIGGYDERYYGGISAEDSDFVRRARLLPDFQQVISEAVSLHQAHSGKTRYYDPPPSVITKARWKEGVALNHAIYNNWNGASHRNPQKWPMGSIGVKEVISNA